MLARLRWGLGTDCGECMLCQPEGRGMDEARERGTCLRVRTEYSRGGGDAVSKWPTDNASPPARDDVPHPRRGIDNLTVLDDEIRGALAKHYH